MLKASEVLKWLVTPATVVMGGNAVEAFSATYQPNLVSPLFLFMSSFHSGPSILLVLFLQPVPSSVSCFHIPCPRGTERTTREKPVTEEKKRLRREKARKHKVCQKRGVSPSDDDGDNDDEDTEDEDEDLVVLQGIPDAL